MARRLWPTLFVAAGLLTIETSDQVLQAQEANLILALAGRWTGTGTMIPASGPSETFKCVVTYFPTENGSRLKQNLRCDSASYRFDGATQLQIAAGKITGSWHDKVYSLDGTVSGIVTASGFLLALTGKPFDANMTVESSSCQQSISIVPEIGSPIKKLSAVLKKC